MKKKSKKSKNTIIDIHVKDLDNLFSDFSSEDNLILNPDFISHYEATYLQQKPASGHYVISVTTNSELTEEKQKKAQKAFKAHYKKEVEENNLKIARLNQNAAISLLIGIIIFIALNLLDESNAPYMWINILEVAAWVFSWQFIENLTFAKIDVWLSKRRNTWAYDSEFNVIKSNGEIL